MYVHVHCCDFITHARAHILCGSFSLIRLYNHLFSAHLPLTRGPRVERVCRAAYMFLCFAPWRILTPCQPSAQRVPRHTHTHHITHVYIINGPTARTKQKLARARRRPLEQNTTTKTSSRAYTYCIYCINKTTTSAVRMHS